MCRHTSHAPPRQEGSWEPLLHDWPRCQVDISEVWELERGEMLRGCRARHPLCHSAIWAHWLFLETNLLPAHTFPQAGSAAKLLVTALPRLRTKQSSAWTSFFLYFPVFHIKGPCKTALNTVP